MTDHTSSPTVTLHALSSGHFTLPSHQFISPCSLSERKTVPSLSFLIQHTNSRTGKHTRILFDLGLRGDLERYPAPIRAHIENRRPIEARPDVVESLARGGLEPRDIDYVIFSHVRVPSALAASVETRGEERKEDEKK